MALYSMAKERAIHCRIRSNVLLVSFTAILVKRYTQEKAFYAVNNENENEKEIDVK